MHTWEQLAMISRTVWCGWQPGVFAGLFCSMLRARPVSDVCDEKKPLKQQLSAVYHAAWPSSFCMI